MTLAITADTKEQLDSDTEAVLSVARKHTLPTFMRLLDGKGNLDLLLSMVSRFTFLWRKMMNISAHKELLMPMKGYILLTSMQDGTRMALMMFYKFKCQTQPGLQSVASQKITTVVVIQYLKKHLF